MVDNKGVQHSFYQIILDLGKLVEYEDGEIIKITKRFIGQRLVDYIQMLEKEATNCEVCGGILPEMHVYVGKKTYSFTCYEIREGKETEKKTNYKKLGEWCQAHGGEKNETLSHRC